MALSTGTPLGNVITQDNISVEGSAYIYFQDYSANPLNNPDGDNYYWGFSGTSTYPVYLLGCVQDVTLGEDITLNAIRCDTVGDKDVVQRRNHLELTLTISSLFPLSSVRDVMNASAVTLTGKVEKMGIGNINNNRKFMVYMPKVYDTDTGDWLAVHLHNAKFVDAWSISMKSGEPWQLSGIKIWAFADDTKPSGQEFATVIRADPSTL